MVIKQGGADYLHFMKVIGVFTMQIPSPHMCDTFSNYKNSLTFSKSIFLLVITRCVV